MTAPFFSLVGEKQEKKGDKEEVTERKTKLMDTAGLIHQGKGKAGGYGSVHLGLTHVETPLAYEYLAKTYALLESDATEDALSCF